MLECQDNKYLKRNDLNFKGTFLLSGVRVIDLEELQHVRPAKLIPRVARNDIAHSQRCLNHTCVLSVLGVTTQILHSGCRECFAFVSL